MKKSISQARSKMLQDSDKEINMDESRAYFDNASGRMPQQPENLRHEKGSGKGLFIGGVITGLACALFLVAIVYISFYVQGAVDSRFNASGNISTKDGSAINSSVVKKLQALEDVIDRYYYLGEVTDEQLQDGLYKGLLQALGDPYSEYYSRSE